MKFKRCSFSKKTLIGTLIVVTTMAMAIPPNSWAMLTPAQEVSAVHQPISQRAADLKTIQMSMESKMVRDRLAELKLSPDQIDSRLSKLSDEQIHQAATKIRTVGPGGDDGSILVTVLLIAILVALFLYIFKRV